MAELTRWVKQTMKCPEGRGETQVFMEWLNQGGKQVLNSISCDNPQLRDLSGSDCQWSCWEEITQRTE